MAKIKTTTRTRRYRRHARIRARISGTAERPRLQVTRGLNHIYAQLIDDTAGKTLVGVHSKSVTETDAPERTGKIAVAYCVGKEIATKAKELHINTVVFDRGGFSYHGRVKAVAEGARDQGLAF